jgi:hypothetical protein
MPKFAPGYRLMKGEDFGSTVAAGLTATPSGTQANSMLLSADISLITTVATAADSVLLPLATPGSKMYVINGSATSMDIWPAVGDIINALTANAAYVLAAGKNVEFVSASPLHWYTNPA